MEILRRPPLGGLSRLQQRHPRRLPPGAGVEYAVINDLTVKGAYLYYNLGKKTMNVNSTTSAASANISAKFKNDVPVVGAA